MRQLRYEDDDAELAESDAKLHSLHPSYHLWLAEFEDGRQRRVVAPTRLRAISAATTMASESGTTARIIDLKPITFEPGAWRADRQRGGSFVGSGA